MALTIVDNSGDGKGWIEIRGPNDEAIATIFPFAGKGGVGREAALANASKIVNADALHDALNQLVGWVEECGSNHEGREYCLMEARAALKNIKTV